MRFVDYDASEYCGGEIAVPPVVHPVKGKTAGLGGFEIAVGQ
jgi:hypothetical protein